MQTVSELLGEKELNEGLIKVGLTKYAEELKDLPTGTTVKVVEYNHFGSRPPIYGVGDVIVCVGENAFVPEHDWKYQVLTSDGIWRGAFTLTRRTMIEIISLPVKKDVKTVQKTISLMQKD